MKALGRFLSVFLVLFLLEPRISRAADVRFFGATKGNKYFQPGPGTPVQVASPAFEFNAFADINFPQRMLSATVKLPNDSVRALTNYSSRWLYRQEFSSQGNMNFGAPGGSYQFRIETTIDGVKTVNLTLAYDFYPAIVQVSNYEAAQNIDWRTDFRLMWNPANADFTQVRIYEGGVMVWETGTYPAAPNALLGPNANSVIIPRNTLQEGRVYTAQVVAWKKSTTDSTTYNGAIAWVAYTRQTELVLRTSFGLNDVQWYGAYKKQRFVQSSPMAPTVAPVNPFEIVAFAEASSERALKGAAVRFANVPAQPLVGIGPEWNLVRSFGSQELMDQACPNGDFNLTMLTENNGLREVILSLAVTPNHYPNQPHIRNWYEAGSINAGKPFNLTWYPFGGGTVNDFIRVIITKNGQPVFQSGAHPRAPGALNGTTTFLALPPNLLVPGEAYESSILFLKAAHLDPYSYPRSIGVGGIGRETRATIRARGGDVSPPTITPSTRSSDSIEFLVGGEPGRVYGIDGSSDLRNWSNLLLTNAPGEHFPIRFNTSGHSFFRAFVY